MYITRHLRSLRFPIEKPNAVVALGRNYSNTGHTATAAAKAEEQIIIPERIERKPTDILYALANTVRRDPTAPHYKYHDDPYLIPASNMAKRTYAMAQEAGRKAAKWIKEEHKELFMHQEAQPAIKAFFPKMVYTEQSEVSETDLQQLIMQSELKDAVFVYNLMKEKGMPISPALQQSLLEFICFHNNGEPLPAEWFEERWFLQNNEMRDRQGKTWNDGDLAEQIFAEIEPKTAEAYGALIRGMAKYNQAERAYALLQEASEKQLPLDTTTYNSIMRVSNFLRDNANERWDLCLTLLRQMSAQQLKPNLGTLNSLLECISSFGNYKFARSCSLKVLAEFKQLGIAPSLGSYYYMLIIFCRDRAPVSHVLVDILQELKGREFTIQHPKDTYFFATAMDVCRNHLLDKGLAKQVDALLHTGNNYNLIGDTYKEAIYYRHYFALLSQTESIDEFMKVYDRLVPNIYTPEPGVMEELLRSIELNAAYEYMPRIWSDMVIFDHIGRQSLLQRTLKICVQNQPNPEKPSEQMLPQQFATVAGDIYQKVLDSLTKQRYLIFTGEMIGDILTLLVRGADYEKANEVFSYIDKNQHSITGTPSDSTLEEYVAGCVANKTPSLALQCLEYAVENHMNTQQLAKAIREGFTLNEVHLAKLRTLVGDSE